MRVAGLQRLANKKFGKLLVNRTVIDSRRIIIEGDFDEYCANMRYPGAWGGEPEILLASHVLKRPIEVHMAMSGEPLRSIGIYGNEDYGTATTDDKKPKLMLLFHGQGHYEALSKCLNE